MQDLLAIVARKESLGPDHKYNTSQKSKKKEKTITYKNKTCVFLLLMWYIEEKKNTRKCIYFGYIIVGVGPVSSMPLA